MKLLTYCCLFLGLGSCKEKSAFILGHSEEARNAALHELHYSFPQYNYLSIWMSGNYSEEHWSPLLKQEQDEIDRLRKWANSLPDKMHREAYNYWLDYFQDDLKSAWKELRFQREKKEMDAYHAQNKRERYKTNEYRAQHDFPKPPK